MEALNLQIQATSVLDEIPDWKVNSGQKMSVFEVPNWNFKQKSRSCEAYLRSQIVISEFEHGRHEKSDAHGHDDVAVAIAFVSEGAHLAGGLFVLELDADGAVGRGG